MTMNAKILNAHRTSAKVKYRIEVLDRLLCRLCVADPLYKKTLFELSVFRRLERKMDAAARRTQSAMA